MIIGSGIDIININRIEKTINKFGDRFKKRCFSSIEINKSENSFNKNSSYAKRYAAKEACSKALGTGLARGVFWKDIEVFYFFVRCPFSFYSLNFYDWHLI